MDMEKYITQRGLEKQLQLSKNSPRRNLKQLQNWISNEFKVGKSTKESQKRWQKEYGNKG